MKKCVLILCVMLSFNAKADDEITIVAQTDPNDATTKCGDNCTWTLYSDGRLEIKGTGDMYGWSAHNTEIALWEGTHSWQTDAPWGIHSAQISSIKVNEGITSIGVAAFYNTAATSADLPDTIISINDSAFQYASRLNQINLPQSVESIGWGSFAETAVQNFVIPENIKDLHLNGPLASRSLENITIDSDVEFVKTIFRGDRGISPLLNNIYCLSTNESCNSLKSDSDIGDKITSFTKEAGIYRLEDGTIFASPNDMMNGTNACSNLDSCKATVLKNKGYCSSDESCMAMVDLENANAPIEYKNKSYASIDDLLKGKYMPKRIYTLEEANAVAGEKNRVSIKYR